MPYAQRVNTVVVALHIEPIPLTWSFVCCVCLVGAASQSSGAEALLHEYCNVHLGHSDTHRHRRTNLRLNTDPPQSGWLKILCLFVGALRVCVMWCDESLSEFTAVLCVIRWLACLLIYLFNLCSARKSLDGEIAFSRETWWRECTRHTLKRVILIRTSNPRGRDWVQHKPDSCYWTAFVSEVFSCSPTWRKSLSACVVAPHHFGITM